MSSPAAAGVLLSAWDREMAAAGRSQRTRQERVGIVGRVARATGEPVDAFTRDGLVTFLAAPQFAPSTRATYWAGLKAWSGWLTMAGHRRDDPTVSMTRVKSVKGLPRPITTPELERLLATRMWPTTRAQILLAAYCGLRVHEIAKVRGEDIRGDSLVVRGKGNRVDVLPLHPRLLDVAARMPAAGWWFPSASEPSGHVNRASVSAVISRTMGRAGVPGTAHSLRHWFGTELVRGGANLRVVQELLRHSSLATTAMYTKVDDRQRRAGLAALPVV